MKLIHIFSFIKKEVDNIHHIVIFCVLLCVHPPSLPRLCIKPLSKLRLYIMPLDFSYNFTQPLFQGRGWGQRFQTINFIPGKQKISVQLKKKKKKKMHKLQ